LIAMRVTPLLLGCLLGLVTAANAAAAAAGGMNASAGCTHGGGDHVGGHDAAASGADALNASHGTVTSSSASSGNTHTGGSGAMDDSPARFGGGNDSSPDGSSRGPSGLGWQSLLPGSIQ
jgi:hypothetical protein